MATVTLGLRPSGNAPGWGWTSAGTLRGTTRAGHTKPVWLIRLGGRVGRYTGTNVSMRFAVYQANAQWVPGALLGQTGARTVTTVMADRASGANYEEKLTAPVAVRNGVPLTLAALGTGGAWAHGQDNSGATMHERSGLSTPPASFGSTWSRPEGTMALWAVAVENEAPTVPLDTVSPRDGATTTDETPTIGIDFRDANEVLEGFSLGQGDKLKKYQIQVWNDARTSKLRDSGLLTASAGQQTARRATWTVPTDLSPGRYTLRAQVYDQFDTPSAWREWKITIVGAGSIELTAPSGTVAAPNPSLGWTYTHRQGLAMDRIVVRITSPTGAVVRADATIDLAPDAATGTSGTVLWTATSWTQLPVGVDYRAQAQAIDTDGQPSPWSAPLAFHVNAAPLMPASLAPAPGVIGTAVPELSALVTDPDHASSLLRVRFTVRPQGGAPETEQTVAGVYNAATGRWTLSPVAAGVVTTGAYGAYDWRVYAIDPLDAFSPTTPWRSFSYVAPAIVAPVAPVGTIDASNPVFTWTVDRAQTAYRVQVWDDATGALVRNGDSGWVSSPDPTHTFHDLLLRNTQRIRARIDVLTTGDIPGEVEWTFDVLYTPPPLVTNVAAQPQMGDFDYANTPSQIAVTWDAVTTDETLFDGYLIRRRDLDRGVTETLAVLPGREQTAYVDDTAGSGVSYEYQVVQRVWQALDLLESPPATAQASVTLRALVLSGVLGGGGRAVLPYWSEISIEPQWDKTVRRTWGARARVLTGPQSYVRIQARVQLIDDDAGLDRFTARDLLDAVTALGAPWRDDTGAVRDRVLCLRDARGLVAYVTLLSAPADYVRIGRGYELALTFVQVAYPGGAA